ncbi:hypothetical protein F5Y15DRAFT_414728 [Xylariaceae sp. FL0016]|nr:hypothetical protein F5Y15DRAFT_414728 [Xylariaceae sp. FL0016]
MHFTALTSTLLAISLASASPLRLRDLILSSGPALHLRARLLPGAADIDPPISGLYLAPARVGAGQNIAIGTELSGSKTDPADLPGYYVNGTEGQTWVVHDLGTTSPYGVSVSGPEEWDATYTGDHDVAINIGVGTEGLTVVEGGDGAVLGGAGEGLYAVCNRFVAAVRADIQAVRYVYAGEEVPAGCVGVEFVPFCAVLDELPEGGEWSHEWVQNVSCYVA